MATTPLVYESFEVEPGDNAITHDAATEPVTVTIEGDLTEGVNPFVSATEFRVIANDRSGSTVSNELVDVQPNGVGAYTVTVELDPHVRAINVSWPFSPSASTQTFAVTNGEQNVGYDADYDTGPQALRLRGIATVGGDPWPGEIEFTVTYRATNGGFRSRVIVPVTPNPVTGAFELTDSGFATSVRFVDVAVEVGGITRTLDRGIAAAGTSTIEVPLTIDGRGVLVAGRLHRADTPVVARSRSCSPMGSRRRRTSR